MLHNCLKKIRTIAFALYVGAFLMHGMQLISLPELIFTSIMFFAIEIVCYKIDEYFHYR